MWALRRASIPIRSHAYCIGGRQVSFVLPAILNGGLEHGIDKLEHVPHTTIRFSRLNNFFQRPSIPAVFFVDAQGLSSHAGTKSGDEDDLEDGFSELEDSLDDKNAVGKNLDGESEEDLISEPDHSEDESKDISESTHEALELSDEESTAITSNVSRKKSFFSPLFKIIMDSPRQSINNAIDKWVEEGNTLGRTELLIAMLNLRKRRMFGRALQLSEWVEANKRIDFVERDYASRLDLIAKVHGLIKAEKYIDRIPESFRGELIYRTLLANCASSLNVRKTEEIFNKMRDLGFPLTSFSCNQLLLLYKRIDRKKIADVLLLMEKENVKPSLFTYKLLIDTKGRSNDISGMEQVIENMKADGLAPDPLTQAMVARHYTFGGLNEKAEAVLKEMEGNDLNENRGVCKLLLPLYASLGKAGEVGRVWKVCEANPRLEECLAAIGAWGHVGRVDKAEAVFEKMLKNWKKLSAKYYTALLKVYANHKLLAKGKELAKQMSDSDCRIGPYTWDALVKLYVEAGEVEKADSILQKAVQQNSMKPLYSSYITVLDKYAKRGDIHNAEKIFHRLRLSGYVGRMQQYTLLLQAYANAKAPAYGFRERLKADNIFPNKTVAGILAQVDAFKKTAISDLLD